MRKLRIAAGTLALTLAVGMAGRALGEYRRAEDGNRAWWGAMYGDALLLAKADGEPPEDEAAVVFVWPLWDSLLRFFVLR
ncbi:MAG: hypothetical protein IJQ62_02515 [Clostridia bacterium]|nr:hypothetical protein [Clostridia bacterium]